jgi:hypothetical protein
MELHWFHHLHLIDDGVAPNITFSPISDVWAPSFPLEGKEAFPVLVDKQEEGGTVPAMPSPCRPDSWETGSVRGPGLLCIRQGCT